MQNKLQILYDNFYYGFEGTYNLVFLRLKAWKDYLGVKFDKSFHEAYKKEIVPFWAQFGIRPCKALVKKCYIISGGSTDPRYIPNDIWMKHIIPYFNNHRFSRILTDKNLNSLLCPTVKRPRTLFKKMSGMYCLDDFSPISREKALALCQTEGRWVIKPTRNSFSGMDVRFFEGGLSAEELDKLLSIYDRTDYIIQSAIEQHDAIAALNPSSTNTIRVITIVFREEARILSSILRVGAPGSPVDNIGAGGHQFPILPDGALGKISYTTRDGKATHEDQSNNPLFRDAVVPGYDKICRTAKELALRIPHLKLIAWDFAVDREGDPVLVEFNAHFPGQNQSTCGPTFGEDTQDILKEICGKKR